MPEGKRLQPVEIHGDLLRVLKRWKAFAKDSSVSEAFYNDGAELGPLNASLGQTSVAWSLSALLGELARRPDIMSVLRPPPSEIPSDMHFLIQANALTSNSVIYRTYVSTVMGRTDEFVEAVSQISRRNPSKHFSATLKLLRSDEVRHLRNAIGHGTFVATGQVMSYRDGEHTRRISFRELDLVNSAIWAVVLTGLTASYKWAGSEK